MSGVNRKVVVRFWLQVRTDSMLCMSKQQHSYCHKKPYPNPILPIMEILPQYIRYIPR